MTTRPRPPAEPPLLAPAAPSCEPCYDGRCENCTTQAWDARFRPTFCACWAENRTGQHND